MTLTHSNAPVAGETEFSAPTAFGTEDLIEAARELAVAVTDEEAHRLRPLGERHHEVARLLGDPALVRIRCHATEVDAAVRELDEEEHVRAVARRYRRSGSRRQWSPRPARAGNAALGFANSVVVLQPGA
jgi:hypothetical protein